jgi:hypothetical protein
MTNFHTPNLVTQCNTCNGIILPLSFMQIKKQNSLSWQIIIFVMFFVGRFCFYNGSDVNIQIRHSKIIQAKWVVPSWDGPFLATNLPEWARSAHLRVHFRHH